MLVAYFDESGTHGDQSKVVTVAGLVGDTLEWSRLEAPWKKRLGKIKTFHATHCAVGGGEFQKMDKLATKSLSEDLTDLISDRNLVAIGGAVYQGDWGYAASPKMKKFYRSAYHFCLSQVLIQIEKLAKSNSWGPVALVFSKQDQYQGYTSELSELYDQAEFFKNKGSLSFSRPECLVELQAADLYAYENYLELVAQFAGKDNAPPVRRNLEKIQNKLGVVSHVFNSDNLNSIAEEMEHLPI